MKTMNFKTNLTKHLLGMLFISILFMGCSPEDGRNGTDGIDGANGETGTANVIYSDWIDSEFDDNIIATGGGFYVDAPNVTQAIIDTGIVLGFAKNIPLAGTPSIFQLPLINDQNQYSVIVQNPGTLRFNASSIDGTSVGTTVYEAYRYVIIPGGNPISSNRSSNSATTDSKSATLDYTKMSYKEIKALFNIPD
ncbi:MULTISPECIES: hypothetical protein [unclassified Winogradskyella]|uniref:hypothetical protein n=1 Tax=unclassified Winogradskyella TaxID=2615021 RepID=UPI002FF072A3